MSYVRVIPILLLKGQGLVKTINFKKPNYIGDPINAVKILNKKEVDELVLLDIDASPKKQEPKFNRIQDIVSESFMPIGYGGGVSSLDQIKRLFDLGIEKVILNSASRNLDLVNKAAAIYGSQSIVVTIDVKKSRLAKNYCWFNHGTEKLKINPADWARTLVNAGVGEIIIQSIDRDGTMNGMDINLIQSISKSVRVPVVACGGAATLTHIEEAVCRGGAAAVAAGSMFVYKGTKKGILINYPKREEIDKLSETRNSLAE